MEDPRQLGETLPALVERVVDSYFSDQRTHHVDKHFLPSKAGIVRICDLLLELTYPAYVGRQDLTRRERRILENPSPGSRIYMGTVKPVYLFVTRRLLGWEDREGARDRGARD